MFLSQLQANPSRFVSFIDQKLELVKHISSIILFFFISHAYLQAQQVNYDWVIPPLETRASDFTETLVQLAWLNNPVREISEKQSSIAEKNITLARWDWTEDIKVSFNLNEGNIKPDVVDNLFFPRYNINVALNVGKLMNTGTHVKIARDELAIANAEENQQKLAIRAEVLRRYQDYLSALDLMKIRAKIEQDLNNTLILISNRFENGEATLTEYNEAAIAHTRAKEQNLEAEKDAIKARIGLEELIGVDLEKIARFSKKSKF